MYLNISWPLGPWLSPEARICGPSWGHVTIDISVGRQFCKKELLTHVAPLCVHFSTQGPFAAAVNRKKQTKAKHLALVKQGLVWNKEPWKNIAFCCCQAGQTEILGSLAWNNKGSRWKRHRNSASEWRFQIPGSGRGSHPPLHLVLDHLGRLWLLASWSCTQSGLENEAVSHHWRGDSLRRQMCSQQENIHQRN